MTSPSIAADLDETHDPARRSWVRGADGHPDFPVQNLPLGIFSPPGGGPRAGVAIGDSILDLAGLAAIRQIEGDAAWAIEATGVTLNVLLAMGAQPRRALRRTLSALLADGAAADGIRPLLHRAVDCLLYLPCTIGDYTDFYVGIHHAEAVGRQFRPDNPLLPNYKYVPIGYHGRASSVRPSGVPVRRPSGQIKPPDAAGPSFEPCRRLDYELELGIWVGQGNAPGQPIGIGQAGEHVAGFCLLNDWSARDIQAWEYQPLGPFISKNFATTISPWVVTPEALAPFRIPQPPRPSSDPAPLPYLLDQSDQASGALGLDLEVVLSTEAMRAAGMPGQVLAISNARHMYWTVAQMVAHHTCGGCDLRPGDLLGSGTISGPDPGTQGSILEATLGGSRPIKLANGEERRFLEDGDEIVLHARAHRDGAVSIGFGECRAVIEPAWTPV